VEGQGGAGAPGEGRVAHQGHTGTKVRTCPQFNNLLHITGHFIKHQEESKKKTNPDLTYYE
jgi:hypothetical protein